ncbi:MAG: aldo/keto reductase [Nitrospinota bacterium]
MEYRKLGSTDIEVSVIGFGAWQIGGQPFWESKGEAESLSAVTAALENGVTLFDTAPVYGFGRSETIIGRALKAARDKVVIATKCGLLWNKEEESAIYRSLKPDSVKNEVEQSLRRLSTDYIDIYQIHWPSPTDPLEATMETMARLKEEGKIRAIGVSNFDTERLKGAMQVTRVDSIQPKYNLLEREAEQELLPYCAEKDIGVLVYSPLASGLLTGKYSESSRFEDWRGNGKFGLFRKETLGDAYKKVKKLKSLASAMDVPLARLAINWLLAKPHVTSALVGVKEARQIKENIECVNKPLSKGEEAELDEVVK